jgi:hypothetical protein
MKQICAGGLGLGAAQYFLGISENFFEHKFVTSKKPEDLADFYGTEDFMEVFCVLPFMVEFMLRGAEFDDNGTIHAWGLLGPGELEVSIDFDEREIDTTGDGEPDTLACFNKKEHFRDIAPSFLGGFTLWEMTQNFGYHRLEDGTCEVYHHGEKFNGLFPISLLFQLHSRYVIWATQKYVNSDAFGTEDRDSDLEEQRHNIPLHVFRKCIQGLTREVEKAKLNSEDDTKKQDKLEVSLRSLKAISSMDHMASMPRLRTCRTRRRWRISTSSWTMRRPKTRFERQCSKLALRKGKCMNLLLKCTSLPGALLSAPARRRAKSQQVNEPIPASSLRFLFSAVDYAWL